MKFKKIAPFFLAAPLLLLTACTNTPSLSFTPNWYSNTNNIDGISDTFEQLTYAVTFTPGKDEDYRVEYDEGVYTTKLESANIAGAEGNPLGYIYETSLTISGRYYVNGAKGTDFTDSVHSKVWFLGVRDGLRPIKSEKTVLCSAPNVRAKEPEDAFVKYNYSYSLSYNAALSKATYTYTDLLDENAEPAVSEIKLSHNGTYLDNEEILFALRGVDVGTSFSFATYDMVTGKVRVAGNTDAAVKEQFTATFTLRTGETEQSVEARPIEANRFSFHFTGDNPGASQKLIYARCTNVEANTYRNVLLHMETEAISELGTFSYDLREAVFNNK